MRTRIVIAHLPQSYANRYVYTSMCAAEQIAERLHYPGSFRLHSVEGRLFDAFFKSLFCRKPLFLINILRLSLFCLGTRRLVVHFQPVWLVSFMVLLDKEDTSLAAIGNKPYVFTNQFVWRCIYQWEFCSIAAHGVSGCVQEI